jgi:hypothetical protein
MLIHGRTKTGRHWRVLDFKWNPPRGEQMALTSRWQTLEFEADLPQGGSRWR